MFFLNALYKSRWKSKNSYFLFGLEMEWPDGWFLSITSQEKEWFPSQSCKCNIFAISCPRCCATSARKETLILQIEVLPGMVHKILIEISESRNILNKWSKPGYIKFYTNSSYMYCTTLRDGVDLLDLPWFSGWFVQLPQAGLHQTKIYIDQASHFTLHSELYLFLPCCKGLS